MKDRESAKWDEAKVHNHEGQNVICSKNTGRLVSVPAMRVRPANPRQEIAEELNLRPEIPKPRKDNPQQDKVPIKQGGRRI